VSRTHEVRVPGRDAAYWARLPRCRAHGNTRPCTDPDWTGACDACGAAPTVCEVGLCGPCTFGEAETAGGNW